MTLSAGVKLGLEALRSSLDVALNREAVEITIIDGDGYRNLSRNEVNAHIDKLKPLEDE
jgi:20S proteasome alpha/beta subunit